MAFGASRTTKCGVSVRMPWGIGFACFIANALLCLRCFVGCNHPGRRRSSRAARKPRYLAAHRMISTSQLGKSYGGRTLFEDVSLQLNPGSRYGLVGANGSGKTTFLKILAGDEPATDGSVGIPSRV